MKQTIKDRIELINCYRVDEQIIKSMERIFKELDPNVFIGIEALCDNKGTYSFSSVDEFIEQVATLDSKIIKMEIAATFPKGNSIYERNKVQLCFSNIPDTIQANGDIWFAFDNQRDYISLKTQLNSLLKNNKVSYSSIAKTPILFFLILLFLMFIVVRMLISGVEFSIGIFFVLFFWGIMAFIITEIPPLKKVKRALFPLNEFEFGVNKVANEKGRKWRSFLGGGIGLVFIVNILANVVSRFIA